MSIEAARINRWADYANVDLWAIAVLQTVGVVMGLGGLALVVAGHWVGAMAVGWSCLCALGASGWYVLILGRYLRRRGKPNFANVMRWRRRHLTRWLMLDLALVAIPPIVWLMWGLV